MIIIGDKQVIGKAGEITTTAPLPILPQDRVTALGSSGKLITWGTSDGVTTFQLEAEDLQGDYAWVLKIQYV